MFMIVITTCLIVSLAHLPMEALQYYLGQLRLESILLCINTSESVT